MQYTNGMSSSIFSSLFGRRFDFLAIGDITTDAFIKLKDAHINCSIDNAACEICMKFGDKIPFDHDEIVAGVGNSANAAVAAARLGLKSTLVTTIGSDQNGRDCLAALRKNGVNTDNISIERGKKTNYHYVLWYEAERTILVNHQEYTYEFPRLGKAPRWIYLSSMAGGEKSEQFHNEIAKYLNENPDVRLAFQPGTFQMKAGIEKMRDLYKRSYVFVCNYEEAQRILQTEEKDIKKLLDGLHALGPVITLITDGPKGAYMLDSTATSEKYHFMPIYPDPKPPRQRTGAGDAFASTFTSALALGKTPLEALQWAPVNSMWVVQFVGAQVGLLTQEGIRSWLQKAPADYKPRVI